MSIAGTGPVTLSVAVPSVVIRTVPSVPVTYDSRTGWGPSSTSGVEPSVALISSRRLSLMALRIPNSRPTAPATSRTTSSAAPMTIRRPVVPPPGPLLVPPWAPPVQAPPGGGAPASAGRAANCSVGAFCTPG